MRIYSIETRGRYEQDQWEQWDVCYMPTAEKDAPKSAAPDCYYRKRREAEIAMEWMAKVVYDKEHAASGYTWQFRILEHVIFPGTTIDILSPLPPVTP